MFDIGASEVLVIVIVAILVIGPKQMPEAMRVAGRWIGKMRRVSGHFRAGIDAMVREAELEDMEREWKEQNAKIMAAHPDAAAAADEASAGVGAETRLETGLGQDAGHGSLDSVRPEAKNPPPAQDDPALADTAGQHGLSPRADDPPLADNGEAAIAAASPSRSAPSQPAAPSHSAPQKPRKQAGGADPVHTEERAPDLIDLAQNPPAAPRDPAGSAPLSSSSDSAKG